MMNSAMAGATRNAIKWLPSERPSKKTIRISRLSSLPRPRLSRQRKMSQVSSAIVIKLTV